MKAMILAAGEGTRLRPLTLSVPKPMVPIVGKPLLSWTLSWLSGQGVTEAVINLYHRPQAIPDFFGDQFEGVRLHYLFEDELRGTSGGVKAAEGFLSDAPFFVVYGDNLIRADLQRMTEFHSQHNGQATLALFHHPNPSAAGIVATDAAGRITRFVEKPPPDQIFADTANAGIYLLDPALLKAIPDATPSDFGRDVFPALLASGTALYGQPLDGYLQDTGTPDQYRQANWDVMAGRLGINYANDSLRIGQDTVISPTAEFRGKNIIGSGVVIGERAQLADCIIWDNARIGADTRLEQAILGYGAVVMDNAAPNAGAVIA